MLCNVCNGCGLQKCKPELCSICNGRICFYCERKGGYIKNIYERCLKCDGLGTIKIKDNQDLLPQGKFS